MPGEKFLSNVISHFRMKGGIYSLGGRSVVHTFAKVCERGDPSPHMIVLKLLESVQRREGVKKVLELYATPEIKADAIIWRGQHRQ